MPQVLIVDDEPAILDIIQEALSAHGLKVRAAQTDHDALALLEAEAERLSLLVTDINLGKGVTGFDIARKARALNPALTVVFITGDVTKWDRFGVDGALLVEKPFDVVELVEKVVPLVQPAPANED